MQTVKHCEQYINSNEVIRILQSNNETFTNRVLECIRTFREEICGGVITSHYQIGRELLNMCREDAFVNAQAIFVNQVRINKFSADRETCIPYLKTIFRRLYWHEYQKELKRKLIIQNTPPTDETGDKEAISNMNEKVSSVISQLGRHDQEIYRLRYEEDMKVKDIAVILDISPDMVTKKLYRLGRRFCSQ